MLCEHWAHEFQHKVCTSPLSASSWRQVPHGDGALAVHVLPRYVLHNTLDCALQYKQQGAGGERELPPAARARCSGPKRRCPCGSAYGCRRVFDGIDCETMASSDLTMIDPVYPKPRVCSAMSWCFDAHAGGACSFYVVTVTCCDLVHRKRAGCGLAVLRLTRRVTSS